MALTYDDSSPGPWTDEELPLLTRTCLTREFALACLHREPPFEDPWLRPGRYPFKALCRHLLLDMPYAPRDADTLLALEAAEREKEPSMAMAAWAIAASRAVPDADRKRRILVEAHARYPRDQDQSERYRVACELWSAAGVNALDVVRVWYFAEMEPHINIGGYQQAIARCVASTGAGGKRFCATVLADPRSKELRWAAVTSLVRACNALAGEEIVRQLEIERLHHPLGESTLSRAAGLAAGLEHHPQETAVVLETLAAWRARLAEFATTRGW